MFSVTSEHKIINSRARHVSLSNDITHQNTRFHWSLLKSPGNLILHCVHLHYTFHSTIENFSACYNTSRGIKLAASQASRLRSACSLAIKLRWNIFPVRPMLRPCFYGLGYPRQPSPPSYPGRDIFHSFVWKILSTVYMRWARQLGEASYLASAGRVTLAGETTFSHVNSLARLPETRQQNLKCARIK